MFWGHDRQIWSCGPHIICQKQLFLPLFCLGARQELVFNWWVGAINKTVVAPALAQGSTNLGMIQALPLTVTGKMTTLCLSFFICAMELQSSFLKLLLVQESHAWFVATSAAMETFLINKSILSSVVPLLINQSWDSRRNVQLITGLGLLRSRASSYVTSLVSFKKEEPTTIARKHMPSLWHTREVCAGWYIYK